MINTADNGVGATRESLGSMLSADCPEKRAVNSDDVANKKA